MHSGKKAHAYNTTLRFLARKDRVCPFFNTFEWRHGRFAEFLRSVILYDSLINRLFMFYF